MCRITKIGAVSRKKSDSATKVVFWKEKGEKELVPLHYQLSWINGVLNSS